MAGPITKDTKLQAYLDALANTGVKRAAREQAGVTYANVYDRSKNDPAFAEAEALALEEAADLLEQEARRRAHDGVTRRKFAGAGENMIEYEETTYSDTLIMFLLKGARPDKFADRQKTELGGLGGKSIEINDTTAAARIAAIFDSARQRRVNNDDTDPFS